MEPGQVRPSTPESWDLEELMGDDFEELPYVTPEEGAQGAVKLYEEYLQSVSKKHPESGGWVEFPLAHPNGEVGMRYLPKVGHMLVLFSCGLCSRF